MRRLVLASVLLLVACGDKQEISQNSGGGSSPNIVAGDNANVTVNNYQQSQDYQDLLAERDDARENAQKYPDDTKFRQALATAEQNLENFKRNVLKQAEEINKHPLNTERLRDVLQLAEDFQRIPLNTERMKLAKKHFDAGEYLQARAVLDAESITQEQNTLLAKWRRQQEELATINARLDDTANEWLLKARLTAIDYSLGEQRIATTSSYFDKALKSGRTPERLFDYAKFLQDNNQFRPAEKLYREALTSYRQLVKDNPTVYLPDVAMTLQNLGNLVAADSQRRKEAENLYKEALSIRRQLAKNNPTVYLPDVAQTLNNLGLLIAADSQRRKEAENLYSEALTINRQLAKETPTVYLPDVAGTLNNLGVLVADDSQRRNEAENIFTEALTIRRQLAKDNPTVYLADVARTLNNLGILVADDSQRRNEAEKLYTEALSSYRQLAKDNPTVYQSYVALTLNNLGLLVTADSQRRNEAEAYYTEALTSYRQLAKDNPTVYLPDVANTLGAFGWAYLHWNEPEQALPLLQESAELFAPFAEQAPNVFGKKYQLTLQLIAQAKAAKH